MHSEDSDKVAFFCQRGVLQIAKGIMQLFPEFPKVNSEWHGGGGGGLMFNIMVCLLWRYTGVCRDFQTASRESGRSALKIAGHGTEAEREEVLNRQARGRVPGLRDLGRLHLDYNKQNSRNRDNSTFQNSTGAKTVPRDGELLSKIRELRKDGATAATR